MQSLHGNTRGHNEYDTQQNITQQTKDKDIIKENRPLTLRRLMSYIYVEHPFLMFLDHTQRRSTVGRTPLDE